MQIISKDIIMSIRRLHGWVHEQSLRRQQLKNLKKYLYSPKKGNVYVLGSPIYSNLGDSAILIAQIELLKKAGIPGRNIKEITYKEYYRGRELIKKRILPDDMICGLGGGNMGNVWAVEEKFRYDMMQDFPRNPIIIFPQTMYYTEDDKGQRDLLSSISVYNGRRDLILNAREQKSFELMRTAYPMTRIMLVPDIVLSATMRDFDVIVQKRKGALLCVRNDAEKFIESDIWLMIEEQLDLCNISYRRMDMYSDCPVTKENRRECVRKKMQEFAEAELVITDRLHGMIFSAITETPCIVFSNYNHKVKGTYDWIRYLPYIKFAENIEGAKKYIPELLEMKECHFDNMPLMSYYKEIEKVVRNMVGIEIDKAIDDYAGN